MKMKIIIDKAIPFMENRFPENLETVFLPSAEITKENIIDADALIIRTRTKCNASLLECSKVKFIATATIGTDHIDRNYCDTKGIEFVNAPGCNAPGVAQYVFASLFTLGFSSEFHTLGIIGYGHVGSVVADWARKMGIRILISDAPREAAGYKDVDYGKVEALLKNCDAVTIHVPFTTQGDFPTLKLISEEKLKMMKPGAILVNSSRGGVVDEVALQKEISHKGIKAVVDVWENEPLINPEIVKLAWITTPHIAGYSLEGKIRATRMALEAIANHFNIPVNLNGLDCFPPLDRKITKELIEKSYNPLYDHDNLQRNLKDFEVLRNNYNYRHEPLFYGIQ